MTGSGTRWRRGTRATTPASGDGEGTDAARLFLVAGVLGVGLAALLVGLVGGVAAGHDSPSNYTVVPDDTPADREPGIEDASYRMFISGDVTIDQVDMGYLEWEEGGFENCGQTNVETYGIDRDGDDPGTSTDENLFDHVKSSRQTEDRSTVWYYDEDDPIGEPPRFNEADEVVIVISDCYRNPSSAGWYQMRAFTNGTAPDGSMVESDAQSHYFWIGNFDSEAEARAELGPPPSEDVQTATPTPTPEPTPTPPPDTDTDATRTVTDDDGDDGDTPTPTAAPTATDTAGEATDGDGDLDEGTATATTADGNDDGGAAPTAGDGSGFGPVVVLAMLAVAMFVRGRRR